MALTAQPDSNNTYLSQLGQFLSRSQTHSPSLRSMTDSKQDLSFRPELTPSKSSPAGNNLRSTSTPVNYHRRSPNSFTRSTSKSHTLSPLYYDYTEAFNIEEAVAAESIARNTTSPIPLIFNKTANERRIVLRVPPQYDSISKVSSVSVDLRTLAKLSIADSSEKKSRLNSEDGKRERSTNVTQDIIPLYLDRRPYERIMADTFDNRDYLKSSQFANDLDVSLQSKSDTSNGSSPILSDTNDRTNHDLDILNLQRMMVVLTRQMGLRKCPHPTEHRPLICRHIYLFSRNLPIKYQKLLLTAPRQLVKKHRLDYHLMLFQFKSPEKPPFRL